MSDTPAEPYGVPETIAHWRRQAELCDSDVESATFIHCADEIEEVLAQAEARPICGKSDLFIGTDGKPGCPHCEVAVTLPRSTPAEPLDMLLRKIIGAWGNSDMHTLNDLIGEAEDVLARLSRNEETETLSPSQ